MEVHPLLASNGVEHLSFYLVSGMVPTTVKHDSSQDNSVTGCSGWGILVACHSLYANLVVIPTDGSGVGRDDGRSILL